MQARIRRGDGSTGMGLETGSCHSIKNHFQKALSFTVKHMLTKFLTIEEV
jgi:hypothetical protein